MENNYKKLSDNEVTAHTAAMWKYNPVPESPEPYPEFLSDSEKKGGFEVTAATVRGKKHKHEGSNCDDSYAFEICDGVVIAAVSDGAGSKIFSRIGARAACKAAIEYIRIRLAAIKNNTPEYLKMLGMPLDSTDFNSICSQIAVMLRDSFSEAYAAVEAAYEKRKDLPEFEQAAGRKPELKDFSCTLLVSVIIPVGTENGKEYLTASIQLGDGMICAIDSNAENPLVILGTADSGSFAGETEFIISEHSRTMESLMSRTKIRRGKFSAFMMMTDGVADDYYPNDPQLLRLVLDLKLNNILDIEEPEFITDVPVPEPVAYPWVNDSDVKYALQYTKNVLAGADRTLELFWEDKYTQQKASLSSFGIVHERERSAMLRIWLDNYVERGSFDDRTLLIITTY